MPLAPRPHYLSLDGTQLRIWQAGTGPRLIVLPGLSLSGAPLTRRLATLCPGFTITAIELPGFGGSIAAAAATLDTMADTLAAACRILQPAVLIACELAAPLAARVIRKLDPAPTTICIGLDRALAWVKRVFAPPALAPRVDGTHLTALWAHVRDCHILDSADPHLPAFAGDPLPDPDELHESFLAFALDPERYEALWSQCVAGLDPALDDPAIRRIALSSELSRLLAAPTGLPAAPPLPPVAHLEGRIWNDFVDLPTGRIHIRRSGTAGRPLLLFPSGGGSSATFAPVIAALAETHQVVAVDYLGNGESEKPERAVTIETLADDAASLADALGFRTFDLWGSHTGALIALELGLRHPDRVGRAVLEGPVFISASFQADLLEKYFPPLRPDPWGLHLQVFWNWRRDLFMYWPWYRVDYAAARGLGIPTPAEMHPFVMGLLQSGPHYDRAYRSAYIYDTRARVRDITCPTLICAGPDDMLVDGLPEAERLAPSCVSVRMTPTTAWWPRQRAEDVRETLGIYRGFFADQV